MATANQIAFITKIAESEFNGADGAKPESVHEAFTWLNVAIETASERGVFVSCANANLVQACDEVISLTQDGFNVYLEHSM